MKKSFTFVLIVCLLLSTGCSFGAVKTPGTNPSSEATHQIEATTVLAAETTTPTTEVTLPTTEPTVPTIEVTEPSIVPTTPPTEATEPTAEPTIPPTEAPTDPNPQLQEWQTAYLDFLKTQKDDHISFALIYIDDDSIPELYLNGCCEALGDGICTYKNGMVVELRLSRLHGGRYIKHSGLVLNKNGNMGYYSTNIYTLTGNGFTNIFSGLQEERVIALENGLYEFTYDYSIEDRAVSEEEFNAAVAEFFDISSSLRFHENAVSYEEIVQQIQNF